MESYLEGATRMHTAMCNPSSNLEKKYIEPLLKKSHMMQNLATCCRKLRKDRLHCTDHLVSQINSLHRFINTFKYST